MNTEGIYAMNYRYLYTYIVYVQNITVANLCKNWYYTFIELWACLVFITMYATEYNIYKYLPPIFYIIYNKLLLHLDKVDDIN